MRSLIAVGLAVVALGGAILLADPGGVLLFVAYALPGVVLAIRRPGQPIAWLLLAMATGLVMGTTTVTASLAELVAARADLLGSFTAWANGTGWAVFFLGFLGLVLVFPAGTFPTGRWRTFSGVLVVAFVPIAVLLVLGPVINVTLPDRPLGADVPNPYALPFLGASDWIPEPDVLWPALFVIQILAMAPLLDRFRRSTGLERLQYRWLAWAVLFVAVANLAWAVVTTVLRVDLALAFLLVAVSYPAIPVAVVLAVLRYRLYEIDRLVSRTAGWALATAAVVTVFILAVLALQTALADVTQGGTLAVAASTLLAFALFQPVRRRVQAAVDRRFDRPRLEAERILARHGEQLRHEVDLETIESGVVRTIAATVRPASAGVWIRRT